MQLLGYYEGVSEFKFALTPDNFSGFVGLALQGIVYMQIVTHLSRQSIRFPKNTYVYNFTKDVEMISIAQFFSNSVPPKPYCSNDLNYGVKIYPKDIALTRGKVQFNKINELSILAVDVDIETYPFDVDPTPNIIVYNKQNGRSHLMYFLENPIHLNAESSLKAQQYLKSIQNGLVAHTKGDPSFSHLLCKNPLSGQYRNYEMHDRLWSLDHLAEYFSPVTKKNINQDYVGFGRNCYVFNTAREWAYKAIRDFKDKSYNQLFSATIKRCGDLNTRFPVPLHCAEIAGIAKSISKWVWKERFNLTSFSKQVARAKKLGVKRAESMDNKRKIALELLAKGLKVNEIATALNASERSVWRWISLEV